MKDEIFQHLTELPMLKRFFRQVWKLFKIRVFLLSPDLDTRNIENFENGLITPPHKETPFCEMLQKQKKGIKRCLECDRKNAEKAASQMKTLKYRCHAGLSEFIIPICLDNEVVAFLQCGQILDKKPTHKDWLTTKKCLTDSEINIKDLEKKFYQIKFLSPSIQKNLIALLEISANYIAQTQSDLRLMEMDKASQVVSRAKIYIKNNLKNKLTLEDISEATYTSKSNLCRVFQKKVGITIFDFIHKIRIEQVCKELELTDKTIAEVAFENGFGSIQQFNRVFKKIKGTTPSYINKKQKTLL